MDKIDLGPNGFIYPMPMTLVGADLAGRPQLHARGVGQPRAAQSAAARDGHGQGARDQRRHPRTRRVRREHSERRAGGAGGLVRSAFGEPGGGQGLALHGLPGLARARAHDRRVPAVPRVPRASGGRSGQPRAVRGRHRRDVDRGALPGRTSQARHRRCMRAFTLTMPDNRYWAVGECIGGAWSIGRTYESCRVANRRGGTTCDSVRDAPSSAARVGRVYFTMITFAAVTPSASGSTYHVDVRTLGHVELGCRARDGRHHGLVVDVERSPTRRRRSVTEILSARGRYYRTLDRQSRCRGSAVTPAPPGPFGRWRSNPCGISIPLSLKNC